MIYPELHIYFHYNKEKKMATRVIKDNKGAIIYQSTSPILSKSFDDNPIRELEEYLSNDLLYQIRKDIDCRGGLLYREVS